ncbi:amino acid adenylation domain-containing protein [Streptomyces humi]
MTTERPAAQPTYPMSFEQESIWLQDQFLEGPSRYVESWVHHLRGPVDTTAVEAAFTAVVAHQEALRSRLGSVDGVPVQTVLPPAPVPVDERRVTPAELEAAIREAISRPVPLERPPLLRATLLRLHDTEAVLAVAMHHAVLDGWSARLLDEQISEAYRAAVGRRPPRLPELPLQFGPYAERQRHDDEVTSPEHLAYWRSVLADAPEESTFPGDRPRPARPSHRGGEIRFTVPEETGTALRAFARAQRATPFVVLISALTALLNRVSGQDDVVLGTPISRRAGTEVRSLLGCLTDVMPLRHRIGAGETFRELVASVRSSTWSAIRHRHIPYGHLVREFAGERVLGRFPLFQIVFTLDDETGGGLRLPGIESERLYRHSGRSKFDLFLNLVPEGDGYQGYLEYSDDLFDAATARRLADRFGVLLADAVRRPDTALAALDITTPGERSRLAAWAAGPRPSGEAALAHLALRPHVARSPDAPAVVHAGEVLSYRELDTRADDIAAGLTALGCGGQCVAVCMGRSLDHPLAVLGVLRAGAACLPLDPDQPASRTAFVLADAGARVVLTDAPGAEALRGRPGLTVLTLRDLPRPAAVALPAVTADSLAYVLYTSGSTGHPKGVAMSHRSLANLVDWQRRDSACGPASRTLQFAPLTFDVAFQELLATWAVGGTLVIADETVRRDPGRLLDLIHEQRVERLILPFVALQQLAEHACAEQRFLGSLKEVITSGEQLFVTPALRRLFSELTKAGLQNQYGPTETHVVTALNLGADPASWPERPSIGRPIDGAEVRVRDKALDPLPVGVPGEICVGGLPVAQGYVGQAAGRSGGFVTGPGGERLYNTGDLGRLLPDGTIEFLGRDDGQVKIHGYRVELQEVEAAVRQVPGVSDAVVVALPGATSAESRLAAHYIPAPAAGLSPDAVRATLRTRLPAHLVPGIIRPVGAFPLTSSGKADRAALARESVRAQPAPRRRPAATTSVQERVGAIWAELLGREPAGIGPDDNFFHMGGDSLLGARLMLRLREEFGVRLGLDAVYGSPTVAGLAALLHEPPTTRPPARTAAPLLPDDIAPTPKKPSTTEEGAAEEGATKPGTTEAGGSVVGATVAGDAVAGVSAAGVSEAQATEERATVAGVSVAGVTVGGVSVVGGSVVGGTETGVLGVWGDRGGDVLLTGGTGFLGAFVLRELVRRTGATVHCLVRARDEAHARRRLAEAAEEYGLWTDETAARTVAVPGDLALPGLGLDPARHDLLARTVDAVYHCGASVNLALPYAELEAANVAGTLAVLRLAALHRAVPVHHVSTVGVFSGAHLLGRGVTADEPLPPVDGLRHGYAQTKWAAESLVRQARLRGLPVSVYRPTRISGDTATGACQPADFLWLLLKGCVQAGLYPVDAGLGFDLVPVDYVSAAIVALSLDPAPHPAAHLASGTRTPLTDLAGHLVGLGYDLAPVSLAQWTRAVERVPDNAAFPLLGVMALEMAGTGGSEEVRFDGTAASAGAAAHGVTLRPLDKEVFRRHVRHFVRTGFLPAPPGPAEHRRPGVGVTS